ncbi:type IV toxin-antitoxin system AbiEi family antitoxin domain-containing protein [Vallicoccus soli]|uniref:type IV toxin-antitoxin system AbiEi family antitoxin domain-containing protein n=1 Tax=Vallicoccus soli TaxID=2339232 RepID=UPI001401E5CA|nr:type IV toxin-antitoxin system AbiEi family antitoxin domain-containing protein [Vallicoccus soli]
MHPGLLALAARQHGPFTTAQARHHGVELDELQRLLRAGVLVRLRRGVYAEAWRTRGDPRATHRVHVDGVLLVLGARAAVSHVSAAVVHGLDLLDPDLGHVEVTRADLGSSRTEARVRHHAAALRPDEVVEVDGRPVTSLARTAIDIARRSTLAQALVVLDAVLHRGVDREELRRVHLACASWSGSRTAGRALALADGGAESPGESLVRLLLARAGLPPVRTQVELRDHDGLVGRVDLLFEQQRTVVEFDGRAKYGLEGDPADALWREKRREDRLRGLGYEVVRVVWADLDRPDDVRRRVLGAFARSARWPRAAS